MDWLGLLVVQGTLKSLLQHHSSKASVLWCSGFFTVQLSHPYMTTGKTIALTRRTFVRKVISLLFNILSRLVITFFPRSKRLLISWLQSPSSLREDPNDGTIWPQRRGNHHRFLDSCYFAGLEVSSVYTNFCIHSSILEWLLVHLNFSITMWF